MRFLENLGKILLFFAALGAVVFALTAIANWLGYWGIAVDMLALAVVIAALETNSK